MVNLELGFVELVILDWTVIFFFNCSRDVIALAGNLIYWQSTESVDSTPTAYTIFSCTFVAQTCFYLLSECTHWLHAVAWLKSRSTSSAFRPKTLTPHRAMSYTLPHLMTPSTGTLSSLILNQSFCEPNPCEDRRPQLSGAVAEPRPFAGCSHPMTWGSPMQKEEET